MVNPSLSGGGGGYTKPENDYHKNINSKNDY